jgi:hypothetical protein
MTFKAQTFLLPAYEHWISTLPTKTYGCASSVMIQMLSNGCVEKKVCAVLHHEQNAKCLLKKPDTAA